MQTNKHASVLCVQFTPSLYKQRRETEYRLWDWGGGVGSCLFSKPVTQKGTTSTHFDLPGFLDFSRTGGGGSGMKTNLKQDLKLPSLKHRFHAAYLY